MDFYKKIFDKSKIKISQILLTLDDTEQRRRALNAKRTIDNLFNWDLFQLLMKMIQQQQLKLNMVIMIDLLKSCTNIVLIV